MTMSTPTTSTGTGINTMTSHASFPPFSSDVKTAPLVRISLSKLEAHDPSEDLAVFQASKDLGFFYLDMDVDCSELGRQIVLDSEAINRVQQRFFRLPEDELVGKYGTRTLDPFYCYRIKRFEIKGDDGKQHVHINDTYNIRKDDLLDTPGAAKLARPQIIDDNQSLLRRYTINCRKVNDLLLSLLERHLQLPPGTLGDLHRIDRPSGDHIRFTRNTPVPFDPERVTRSEHTDFGTITILFNWLGGLQIRHPQTVPEEWVYVRPIPGSAVVNLGDALVTFTSGILRSDVHRVAPAPPPQDGIERFSLVFFTRPEDEVVLKRLKGGLIDKQPMKDKKDGPPPMTAHEWTLRRATGDLVGVYTAKGLEARTLIPS